MIAFACSGGGTLGSQQVGALRALTERNIVPGIVTGTSAGALNGAMFCAWPTLDGLSRLADVWIRTRRDDVWPGSPFHWAWAALTGKLGLVSYGHLLRYVERQMDFIFGRHDLTYADLQIPLRVTTVDVDTRLPVEWGSLHIEPLALTVTASAAMPFVSEPVPIGDWLLTDGGVANPLPIDIAIRYGATEIYALDLSGGNEPYMPTNILEMAVADFDAQQQELAARGVRQALDENITLHHVQFNASVGLLDFSQAARLIDEGHRVMHEYLDNPHPLRTHQK